MSSDYSLGSKKIAFSSTNTTALVALGPSNRARNVMRDRKSEVDVVGREVVASQVKINVNGEIMGSRVLSILCKVVPVKVKMTGRKMTGNEGG